MTHAKTVTGKIRDLRFQEASKILTCNPYELYRIQLRTQGYVADLPTATSGLNLMLDNYDDCRDKKFIHKQFIQLTNMTIERFLDTCLGGYEAK